jgi:23S rRNA (cytosine1962-C5)-methyltransferase
VVDWGRRNMEASGLDGIRWVVEDAATFVRREVKRGKTYQGILLDPPAYGRGPAGEKWVLEEQIDDLLRDCAALLAPGGFLALNLYSMGLSAVVAHTLISQHFKREPELLELAVADSFGKVLPLGTVARLSAGV